MKGLKTYMRVSINDIQRMKEDGEKITMLTAYDCATAAIMDGAGVPMILVGDSLGMVVLGYESTIAVTMEEMIHHTRAVVRGAEHALIVGDMPFMTYHISEADAMRNAARFIQQGGAQVVKLEGGVVAADKVKAIVGCGIPVLGHIGLTPQSMYQLGGYKAQGKTREAAKALLEDARALEEAGAFAIVLETVPAPVAALITSRLQIPTIGIGAGPDCDGQVQVISDILGLSGGRMPKHARQYADLAGAIKEAVVRYDDDVKKGRFPTAEHSPSVEPDVLEGL